MCADKRQSSVMVVDDEPESLRLISKILTEKEFEVRCFTSAEQAFNSAEKDLPDIVILDILMPEIDGFQAIRKFKDSPILGEIPIIFSSGIESGETKEKAFSLGAVDYISKPFHNEEIVARVRLHDSLAKASRLLKEFNRNLEELVARKTNELAEANKRIKALNKQLKKENYILQQEVEDHQPEDILGDSDEMKYLFHRISQVSPTDSSVLLLGETGTGKDLVANAIHKKSLRSDTHLVKLNCASLPDQLIESELFGHEKGAFTGAIKNRQGRFELAHKGTLFLDEIGEIPLDIQVKLLRVIQDGELEHLGSNKVIKVNVRIIAATNRDLESMVDSGTFRKDLWYRLNVFQITLPPLKDRLSDIPLLVNHFINVIGRRVGKRFDVIDDSFLSEMMNYNWPGNVRELEHVIERAMIVSIPPVLKSDLSLIRAPSKNNQTHQVGSLAEAQREHILSALDRSSWIIDGPKGAAKMLECHPNTLRYRMKKLNISRPDR